MSDLAKSLKEIFDERISSPFYGSLIVSWLVWNWEIPYVTFFVDQSRLGDSVNKIEYIYKHCSSFWFLVVGPLVSTAFIILVIPFVTNGAYWVTEIFDNWRINKKKVMQGKQLLNEEDRINLLLAMEQQEEKYSKLFIKKDEEIKFLKEQLDSALKNKKQKEAEQSSNNKELISISRELTDFFNNRTLVEDFKEVTDNIQNSLSNRDVNTSSLKYFDAYGLIDSPKQNGYHLLTEKGKLFLRELLKHEASKAN